MSRLQLALNVNDLNAAIVFYSTLFGTEPAKTRPGYANFEVVDPPLKLVLFENPDESGTLNHLGIEHETLEAVRAEGVRLHETGQQLLFEENVDCCNANQTKFWVEGPDGQKWENYVVLSDSTPELEGQTKLAGPACCAGEQGAPSAG
ncbi:ArsI/CadI family heavy metal resistance metalloenzyme [Granulicoccus sp. GXG6511]|uniref:ArsI/CadI family heavy metal resistance metalloenzyme n=1 Tax=Granulicoccus sp. GXG6511 TaxID=3381351 RepID=UPI003D7D0EDE